MAMIRKVQPIIKRPLSIIKKPIASNTLALPTEMNIPSEDMGDYSWMFYGTKKIGKSSLAAQFPDALFMMFEPGAKALRTYQVNCNKWEDAKQYLTLLEKGGHKFKTVVIDTGFEAYQKCFNFVCQTQDIEYPREENFGKDWKAIENEFREFHNRLASMSLGLIVLCHETMKESQTRSGNKFDMVIPNLPKAADSFFRAIIDNVCWYHFRKAERFLLVKGSDYAMAGTAVQSDEHFLTKSGDPVFAIPMGTSAKEGYNNLVRAFRNQQIQTFSEETEKYIKEVIQESVDDKLRKAARRRK
jgi:hypothetical protein